jgi:hypothetical protein
MTVAPHEATIDQVLDGGRTWDVVDMVGRNAALVSALAVRQQ